MHRGEVWWAELPPPAGRRPVVLLSRNEAYAVRNAITVAPITSTIRGIPVEVLLGPGDGLPKRCAVNLDTIVTIRKALLRERIAALKKDKIDALDDAIRFALALE